jgi:beta-galactosidase
MAAVHGTRVRRPAEVRDSARVTERALGWPSRLTSIAFGGDYKPEQWDEEVWAEDLRLMHEAGVNLVTVNVFGWAEIEPAPGHYDFERLDRVMDLLAAGGIHVDLATGTASPPPWFSHRYPDTLPVTREGICLSPGGRQAWCPSSPVFRWAALALVEAVATRYAHHPALVMWHVSNELGCHNAHCYCDVSADAFRRWLHRRYGDLDRLNDAWAT